MRGKYYKKVKLKRILRITEKTSSCIQRMNDMKEFVDGWI